MKTQKALLGLVCALGLVAGSAAVAAAGEDVGAEPGAYIGLGGVFAINNFDDSIDVDHSNGFHVRGGYRVHPHIAVEALYEHYLGFETDPGVGHYEGWSLTANVKGYILTGRWQPYVLLGLGYLDINYPGPDRVGGAEPGDDFAMRFGAGMDVCFGERWALGPELAYVLPVGDAEDLDLIDLTLGLRIKF